MREKLGTLKYTLLAVVAGLIMAGSTVGTVHAGGSSSGDSKTSCGKAGVSIRVGGAVAVDAGTGNGCSTTTTSSHEEHDKSYQKSDHSSSTSKSHDDSDDGDDEDDDDKVTGKGSGTTDKSDDSKPVSGKATLPATGAGGLTAVFAAATVAGVLGYRAFLRRQLAR